MKKYISKTREEYKYSYKMLRLQGEAMLHDFPPFPGSDAEECALISYDYHDSEFSGWINRQRFQIFKQGAEGYINSVWWKPF